MVASKRSRLQREKTGKVATTASYPAIKAARSSESAIPGLRHRRPEKSQFPATLRQNSSNTMTVYAISRFVIPLRANEAHRARSFLLKRVHTNPWRDCSILFSSDRAIVPLSDVVSSQDAKPVFAVESQDPHQHGPYTTIESHNNVKKYLLWQNIVMGGKDALFAVSYHPIIWHIR